VPPTTPGESLGVTGDPGGLNGSGGPPRDDDRTDRGSEYPNRDINRTPDQIRESLKGRGFQSSRSTDGRAEIWTKGNRRYTIRPSDSSPSAVKVDVYTNGTKIGELIPK
jgi:hypothetical protein